MAGQDNVIYVNNYIYIYDYNRVTLDFQTLCTSLFMPGTLCKISPAMASVLIFAFSSSKQNIENVLLVIMPELNVDLVQLRPPETKKKKKTKLI